jgi:hypothetical protein
MSNLTTKRFVIRKTLIGNTNLGEKVYSVKTVTLARYYTLLNYLMSHYYVTRYYNTNTTRNYFTIY